ncbi:MAG: SDR family oxidoreductase [Acidobacteria bacterium]|nr:SDR family oxidoreductase [Acidobacteriota bacterium]
MAEWTSVSRLHYKGRTLEWTNKPLMTSEQKTLKDRVALISGALGSIGRAVAMELGRRGAVVALSDIHSEAQAAEFLQQCERAGIQTRYRQVDVSQAEQVDAWIADTESALGVASIVVPCAAIVTRKGVREVEPAEWRREMEINVDGTFHVAQKSAMRMAAKKVPGSIVFLGSWVAERPMSRIATYCSGKAALRMLMQCMALEFAADGIMVNEVAPGYVDAGLTGVTLKADPERRKVLEALTPIGRLIEADEVAFHVANLCDARSSGVTGTTLLLDGGASLRTS